MKWEVNELFLGMVIFSSGWPSMADFPRGRCRNNRSARALASPVDLPREVHEHMEAFAGG
jgi:hypothetical protein